MAKLDDRSAPGPVDLHVGRRVRELRLQRALTQSDLAGALRISFQQLQKYEKGSNRISSSKLWEIAQALKVDINDFFIGLPLGFEPETPGAEHAPIGQTQNSRAVVALVRALPAAEQRLVLDVIRSLAAKS